VKAAFGRYRELAAEHLWPVAVLYGATALLCTFANAPGEYIGDNRYDQFASPGRRLTHSLALWDGSRGLGRVREDLWIGFTAPMALLRSFGFSVWATERVFHAGLLALGAVGVVAVLRTMRPRIGPGHVLAGFVYGFGPYAAAFLQPSNLYAAAAATPWLALAAFRGITTDEPWRWGAAFAVVVFLLGNADPPGVLLAALVVVPVVLWLLLVERSVRIGQVVRWLLRAGVLAVGVSTAALFKTWVAAATFSNRLDTTESPAIINSSSSWAETLRGLGFWLTYFRGAGLARPQTEVYFSNAAVVLATMAVPAAALASIALSRERGRLFMGACVVMAAVVMVGSYPLDAPSALGRLLLDAYAAVPSLAAFRTSYKIGGVLALGMAGLVGLGYAELLDRLRERGRSRVVPSLVAFGVVAVAAVPFWSGGLYDTSKGYRHVPTYWRDALRYVDALPGDGRVLILPGSTRTQYRWGWVGDDIFDALLRRDHAIDTAIPLSEPEAANLLHAIDQTVVDGTYRPGTIAPILERLGIDRVIIRNDVDWQATRTIRPAQLDSLRRDSGLRLLRTFGRPGEETTAGTDHTAEAQQEARLPPVEVYEVRGTVATGPRLVSPSQAPVLVSGDGEAWPLLAQEGDLAKSGPVRYSADVPARDLASAVAGAARVLVTDTNRRRVVTVNGFNLDEGPTLAAGQDQDRPAADLFKVDGSQTVAWYRDATRISATGASRGLRGSQPATRAAAAFDGNPSTAWQTIEGANQAGLGVRVDFRHPTRLSEADITALGAAAGVTHVTSARLVFSDGSQQVVPLTGASVATNFKPRTVRWVKVEIAQMSAGAPHGAGFSEISFPGVDLREWIDLPDDVARRAAADPKVAAALRSVPVAYQFERARPVASLPSEPILRRRFRVASARTFTLTATVRPAASATVSVARTLAVSCGNRTITVDGDPVGVRLVGSVKGIRPGDPLLVASCSPVPLGDGWHRLEVAGTPVTDLRLASPAPHPRPFASLDTALRVRHVHESPGRVTLEVDAPAGARLISGQSWEKRWVATVDGRSLGPAVPLDTLSGWTVPKGRRQVVVLTYRPQTRFAATLLLSGLALAVCLVLLLRPRRRGGVDEPPAQAPSTSSS